MKLLFERSEYLARIARPKQAMAERGIDLLLVASPANQFWLTGYDGWSFYTPQMVALRLDHEEPIWVGRKMDAVGAKFTAFLKPANVVPYPAFNYPQFSAPTMAPRAMSVSRDSPRHMTMLPVGGSLAH